MGVFLAESKVVVDEEGGVDVDLEFGGGFGVVGGGFDKEVGFEAFVGVFEEGAEEGDGRVGEVVVVVEEVEFLGEGRFGVGLGEGEGVVGGVGEGLWGELGHNGTSGVLAVD